MTAAQREEYYSELPPLMYHFPHIYMLQQRSLMQREKQQQMMQQAAGGAGGGASKTPGRLDANALRASGMLSFLSSAEGRQKLTELSSRVQNSRTRLEPLVKDWTLDRKREYFNSFADHPIVQTMSERGDDPAGKMQMIIDMPEADIDQLMTLLIVIGQEDQNSEFIKSLTEDAVGKANDASSSEKGAGKAAIMNALVSTMGSLSNFGAQRRAAGGAGGTASSSSGSSGDPNAMVDLRELAMQQQSHGHNHNHSHSHDHGHSHNHGAGAGGAGDAATGGHRMFGAAPDVSTGKAESMDR